MALPFGGLIRPRIQQLGPKMNFVLLGWFRPVVDWGSELKPSWQPLLACGVPALLTVLHPSSSISITMGGLAGALSGLSFAYPRGLYPQGGRTHNRRAWLIIGLMGLSILYSLVWLLSPGRESFFYFPYLWACFAAIGLWMSFLVPRIVATAKMRWEV